MRKAIAIENYNILQGDCSFSCIEVLIVYGGQFDNNIWIKENDQGWNILISINKHLIYGIYYRKSRNINDFRMAYIIFTIINDAL